MTLEMAAKLEQLAETLYNWGKRLVNDNVSKDELRAAAMELNQAATAHVDLANVIRDNVAKDTKDAGKVEPTGVVHEPQA